MLVLPYPSYPLVVVSIMEFLGLYFWLQQLDMLFPVLGSVCR